MCEKIVLIDDDNSVRRAFKRWLKSTHFEVEDYASAELFLESWKKDVSIIMILDVRLPGMSGLELQEELVGSGYNIPIIFITAHYDKDTYNKAIKAGAVDFLRKPFDENDILDAISRAGEKSGFPNRL